MVNKVVHSSKFHDYVNPIFCHRRIASGVTADAISFVTADAFFLPGRVRFVGTSSGAPFPSMIVIYYATGRNVSIFEYYT